jgi:hypothetical protein
MDWQINKLSVDVNTDQTSMVLEVVLVCPLRSGPP